MFTSNLTHINRRGISFLTMLTLLLMPLLSQSNLSVRAAPAYTEVGGPIMSDTTWTLTNSPYIVVANVEVWQGVTLTVQPGVVVKFNKDKLLQVNGALIARGTAVSPITFTSNQASPTKGDWKNIEFSDGSVDATFDGAGNYTGGSILEYCVVEYGGSGVSGAAETDQASPLIDHCAVRNNQSSGIRGNGFLGPSMVIRNNTVSGNSASGAGGGIYVTYSTVTGNIVSGNSAGSSGGIYASLSSVISNTITANRGLGVYFNGSNDFLYNTIVGNIAPTGTIGGVAIRGTPQFHHNNLYGNSNWDVGVMSPPDINISGTHNYWGTVATEVILAHVYDWYDDSSRGRLLFIPYIQDPDPNAPVPPPWNLRANFAGGSVSLSWDAIPSTTTGYGYKVYYDTDTSGPPYHGAGAAQGDSPIDVGNATQFTLSGLGGGGIYTAVTAYDTQGRESWYSNEVMSLWRVYLPAVLKK
ncbi:MAG: hypothetical protein CVU38_06075 [Chloroflexi bacterium HGW-Chloroflexi-1]|nr:MAG: hypothetical protein CVU38_06075 [Chloroflexi bacterium HGW-Chloroflexi-1]